MLDDRKAAILRAVVEEYIETAQPVGSQHVAQHTGLSVSPATVRNEMAVLEDNGYVRQLHTSGGRVPTNAGYQYYVERLMDSSHVPDADARTIRHQFHQAYPDVHEWLKLAATVIANRMHNVGLITAPKTFEVRLRHLEMISIQSTVALLIVVLQDGSVLQEMLALREPFSQDELSVLSARLNEALHGLAPADAEARLARMEGLDESIAFMIAHMLRRAEQQATQVFHAGLADMMRQPEFLGPRLGEPRSSPNERLGQMVEFLHRGYAVDRLLSIMPPATQVQVVIGGDAAAEGLRDYSFVMGRYGDEADGSGFLGVIGPTRMEYPRAIALVRYMSELMTDLMQAY